MENQVLLEVKNLKKHFPMGRNRILKAVDGVSFSINRGETLGLVGESGCGKSTLGRTLIHLKDSTAGEIHFKGNNITELKKKERISLSREMQMIFQDPYSSLNPRMTVGDIIAEGWDIHGMKSNGERSRGIDELLKLVGLNHEHASRFPHEFSGGQRQRIGVARALSMNPEFIICDEPISALDVSIQAQVMNLLIELQESMNLTYLFIAHDLSMVRHISDHIAVMYLGHIMEYASSDVLCNTPKHPYTKTLFSAIPVPDPEIERNRTPLALKGDISSPINPPPGCRFASRCPEAKDLCFIETPEYKEIEPGHMAACHYTG
jgi:oligopeptide transport system ATP-binding protein